MRQRDKGSASALFLVTCWTLILCGLVIGADLGRIYLYREQVETAVEAAALAGAAQVVRKVEVTVDRSWSEVSDCALLPEKPEDCEEEVTVTDTRRLSGEYPLVGWRSALCSGGVTCGTPSWRCWLDPRGGTFDSALTVADAVFWQNATGKQWAPYVSRPVTISRAPSSSKGDNWGWFYVRVRADAEVPTLLWNILGKSAMKASRVRTDGEGHEGAIEALAKPLLKAAAGADPTQPPLVCGGAEAG